MIMDAIADTYIDCEALLAGICHRFRSRYGGEFDDWMGEAALIYMHAYESYDGSTKFSTWLHYKVEKGFLTIIRNRANRSAKMRQRCWSEKLGRCLKDDSFQFADFIEQLSQDATIIVELTINTPKKLRRCINATNAQPRTVRSSLRKYLRSLGWTADRISESFTEIARAL